MSAFIWDNSYKTGVAEMDCEHVMLFSLYNQLCSVMDTGKHAEALEDIINALITYTRMHFAHEEQYMERVGYAGADDHKESHHEIVMRINRLYDSFEDNGPFAVAHDLKAITFSWLAGHILKVDKAYGEFAKL
jgi:hemerythrin